ncbi:MAG: SpoVA/SpoVAEb family sporulation membrane protein [Firmicutes bacterium]|nr:SpoVA/SpoVAEb family sporulation membrane protein [Bacillota bacterium]
MDIFLTFLYAFLVGGAICLVGQILILKTNITPSRILVIFVAVGVVLGAAQVFDVIRSNVGAGITVPIVGFGGVLSEGVINAVREDGILGVFTGALTAAAAGIAAAIVFAFIVGLISKSKVKT